MTGLKIGYARVSTTNQDLAAQRDGLAALGVNVDRIYVDHGLTGTTRARPGLREALAACRAGDTLVVTKLDRLARSLPDARDIVEELTTRGVRLQLGGSVHDATDPVGRLLFNVLAMVAESDLIRTRTREGLAVARAAGKLRGRSPSSPPHGRRCSSTCTRPARRARPTWRSYSASAGPRSTARSSARPIRPLLATQEQPRPHSDVRTAPDTAASQSYALTVALTAGGSSSDTSGFGEQEVGSVPAVWVVGVGGVLGDFTTVI
ncbi:MAG: recombinase family protein [Nocardioidaceae bacterium]